LYNLQNAVNENGNFELFTSIYADLERLIKIESIQLSKQFSIHESPSEIEKKLEIISQKQSFLNEIFNEKKLQSISLKNVNTDYCNAKCTRCPIQCTFNTIDAIRKASQFTVLNELALHGHPRSRKINNKWRTTSEAIEELIEHYKQSHNMNSKLHQLELIDTSLINFDLI